MISRETILPSSNFPETWRALPIKPIWPGFAINTIFYAVILWALGYAPVKLRSFVRDRRGMCPSCGYDLRHVDHAVCPECGATP